MSPEVILEGRLHPASIVLAFLAALRRTALWLLVFAYQTVTAESAAGFIAGVVSLAIAGALSLVGPVVHWLRYRYRLTATELAIDSGFIRRQQRRIPISRVQDLSFEAGPFHRLLGVVVVAVQTSGTEGAEAKLDAITRAQGEALERALRSLSGRAPRPEAGDDALAPPILEVGVVPLVVRGLTDNRAGLILAGILGFFAQVIPDDDVSFFVRVWELGQRTLSPIIGRGFTAIALFVATVVALLVIVGWIGSAILNVVRFYGFALREEDGVFTRSYGLFTRRIHALPRRRIQAVRLEQTLLRRLLGYATIRTDDMGAGAQAKTAEAQGTDVFVPLAPHGAAITLLPRVLPAADARRYVFRETSPRIVRRSGTRFAIAGVLGALALYSVAGPWAFAVVVPAFLLGLVWGFATLRTLRWSVDPAAGLAVRRGVFRREEIYAPRSRLEALTVVESPFDRYHGVATLLAIVGGGARIAIPNVPAAEAREAARLLMGAPIDPALVPVSA